MFFGDGVETSHVRLHMKFRGYMYSVLLLMSGNFMYVQKMVRKKAEKKS